MRVETMVTVINSLYLSRWLSRVEESRGGLMLVAEPESLKSAMLNVLEGRQGVSVYEDLNSRKISRSIRPMVAREQIKVLVLPEFQKIFERRDDTWKNTMGNLRAFVHDGIVEGANDEPGMVRNPAMCTVFAGLTIECFEQHVLDWNASGFLRRVLWCHYKIMDDQKEILHLALRLRHQIDFGAMCPRLILPDIGYIPDMIVTAEQKKINDMWRRSATKAMLPHIVEQTRLLYMIYSVLKWQHSKKVYREDPMFIMEDFIPSLGTNTAVLFPDSLIKQLKKAERDKERIERKAAKNGRIL